MSGKTDKRLHDRTKLSDEEMQKRWDAIFGKKDKKEEAKVSVSGDGVPSIDSEQLIATNAAKKQLEAAAKLKKKERMLKINERLKNLDK